MTQRQIERRAPEADGGSGTRRTALAASAAVIAMMVAMGAAGQGQAQGGQAQAEPAAPPPTARAAAPIDLTGDWVSIVSEDWRWRMVTPARGDYTSIPINEEAKTVADAWDPARDETAGEQCKSYGAPALMRIPGRLRIRWQDDNTLQVDTDAGTQTRLFHFGDAKPAPGAPGWQGYSVAEWQVPRPQRGSFGPGVGEEETGADGAPRRRFGNLKVITTNLREGYLRKNGVPYSADTVLTEYWDLIRARGGDEWIVITTVVEDPTYLQLPWVTSLNFRKEPDGSKWDPTPCSTTW